MARPSIEFLNLRSGGSAVLPKWERRILHLIPFLWSGAGDVVTRLAASQRETGTVGIVTSGSSRGQSDWPAYLERMAEAGVHHFEVDLFDRSPDVFWDAVAKLGRIVREFRPDVVHCHAGVPAAGAAAVRSTGAKFTLIGQLHSWGNDRPDWMNTMDLWGFGRCDRVISNADTYRSILRESGIPHARIVSIPWGLDLERIRSGARPAARRRRLGAKLGFVGRIEPRKRQLELIDAFGAVAGRGRDLTLELVGPVADAAYGARVTEVVRSRGLESRVDMTGQVRSVYSRVEDWDVFVSLSSDEGQGMAVLEAMALGVPVVATDAPGIRDYLRDGLNGFVPRSVAPDDVADTLEWVLDHPGEMARAVSGARDMVEQQYSWDRTVLGMDALYSTV